MAERNKSEDRLLKREVARLSRRSRALQRSLDKISLAAAQLRDDLGKYSALIESADDSIYLVDTQCRYLFMNKKHLLRMGIRGRELVGRKYGDFHSAEETSEFVQQVEAVLRKGKSCQYEHQSVKDNGFFLRTLSPLKGTGGKIKAVSVISKNITALKNLEAELYALSLSDDLTGLYNRRGFLTLGDQQIKVAKRMKRSLLLIYADMNDMKKINDTYGHALGDAAIKAVAGIMKGTFRESDIVARIGGDEFAILITAFSDGREDAILKKLDDNMASYNLKKKHPFKLSISTGFFICGPATPCALDDMLVAADARMYAKKAVRPKSRR
ncbi:MAG TPA: GGDEF domain-containing protein [Dissulfurispiraceae bacterium]|nr:GGDEF domain-containing protein [Dissulfurispiraceae bacterium]